VFRGLGVCGSGQVGQRGQKEWHFGVVRGFSNSGYSYWCGSVCMCIWVVWVKWFSMVVNSRERVAFGLCWLYVYQCKWSGLEFGQAGLLWVAYMFVRVVGLAGIGVTKSGILKGFSS